MHHRPTNVKAITTHLQEVRQKLKIMCSICFYAIHIFDFCNKNHTNNEHTMWVKNSVTKSANKKKKSKNAQKSRQFMKQKKKGSFPYCSRKNKIK